MIQFVFGSPVWTGPRVVERHVNQDTNGASPRWHMCLAPLAQRSPRLLYHITKAWAMYDLYGSKDWTVVCVHTVQMKV